MKKFLMAVIAVMISVFATTCWAADGQAVSHKPKTIHEETATAGIMYWLSSCNKISIEIIVVRKNDANELNIGIMETDECVGIQILNAYGTTRVSNKNFQINGLDYAKLYGVIKVYDQISDSFFDVFIDTEWDKINYSFLGTYNYIQRELGETKGYASYIYRPSIFIGNISFNNITLGPAPSDYWAQLSSNNIILPKTKK